MKDRTDKQRILYQLLYRSMITGIPLSKQLIAEQTKWSLSTVNTYIAKKLYDMVKYLPEGNFCITSNKYLRDEETFIKMMSQVRL